MREDHLRPEMTPATRLLGLDIGGTKCAAIIGDAGGQVLARRQWPSVAARGSAAMLADLVAQADTLLQEHGPVQAVGAAIGGPLDAARGVVYSSPNLPGWDGVPLKALLHERFHLPVRVEHDAAACALAEYHWGAGRGVSRLVYLTCGTGFGSGLVFDGRPYYGADGRTGEIGHIHLAEDGPLGFGRKGSAEGFCAGSALGRIAVWKFPARWSVEPGGRELAALAAAGDPQAREVIAINARAVGRMGALVADLLCPQLILLGSLAKYLGPPWLTEVRRTFQELAHPQVLERCRVGPAGLGERLQDCSALVAARGALVGPAEGE